MLSKMKCLEKGSQTNHMTQQHKKLLETLKQEKKLTGKFNEPKFIGPLFWKNALIKNGLRGEEVLPKKFEGKLILTKCRSCGKSFSRIPTSANEGNILTSKPPCSSCIFMQTKPALYRHKTKKHCDETPPFICQECLLESDTWYKYVQHMKMHLRYEGYCSECEHYMVNKPYTVLFLCHICEMTFNSTVELKVHVQTCHSEN